MINNSYKDLIQTVHYKLSYLTALIYYIYIPTAGAEATDECIYIYIYIAIISLT